MISLLNVKTVGQEQAMDGRMDVSRRKTTEFAAPVFPQKANTVSPKDSTPLNSKDLEETIKNLQSMSDLMDRRIRFNVNRELGKVVISIIDPETNTVVKEIPSKDIQKLQMRMKETLGILVDEKS
ncbi:MAG: flagellar protein FlaG [Spirochaetaceae bacterium]|jgi:flagellar protein FlaG|nr:flagellar protein FlaG [Spirochaetaceae bacterium]